MVVKILNVQDEEEEDRMGSVLLLCYGNRAAIAAHQPISAVEKKNIWSSDGDSDDDHDAVLFVLVNTEIGAAWTNPVCIDSLTLSCRKACPLSPLPPPPSLPSMQLLHLDCQQTDRLVYFLFQLWQTMS